MNKRKLKRYLLVGNHSGWIDTKTEWNEYGRLYYVKKGQVYYYYDENGIDYYVGPLLKQKEELDYASK